MKRVAYDPQNPPPKWPIPLPPPPKQNPVRRYFPGAVLVTAIGLFVYIYFNQDEEVFEYWKQVEQGNVPLPDDDDDDDDNDDDGVEWEDDINDKQQLSPKR